MKRRLKNLVALALTVAMVFSLSMTSVFAYSSDIYSSNAPKETVEVDKTELSGATAAANTTAMSILGIDVTSTDVPGAIGNADDPLNLLVFGSDLNENPDPYLWNFYYNLNANGETYPNKLGEGESNTGKPIDEWKDIYKLDDYKSWKGAYTLLNYAKAGPTGAATDTEVIPIQVNSTEAIDCNPLFYFEPNVLMGGTEGSYTVGLDYYKSTVNSKYAPLEVYGWGTSDGQYAINTGTLDSTVAMANGVYTMAKDINAYAVDSDLTGRYGSVLQCGVDYSNFALGIYFYVQLRMNDTRVGTSQLEKAHYCTGIKIENGVITVTNDNTLNRRYLQYLDGLADLVPTGTEFSYTNTSSLKGNLDLIIMDKAELEGNQERMITQVGTKIVDVSAIMPNTVYGTTMQSADNILGLPYFVGLLYEGRLSTYSTKLSEYDYLAYFVDNIYHVDSKNVQAVVEEMISNGCGSGYTKLTSNYTYLINEMIELGADYYESEYDGPIVWQAIDDLNPGEEEDD